MSDLTDRRPDQQAAPSARIEAANRPRRDRRGRLLDLVFVCALLFVGCVKAPETTGRAEVHRSEVWVDAFSAAGGDGSASRPWKVLPPVLSAGVTVKVRSGLYAGPFVLEAGARLEGVGEVVLTGTGDVTVVTANEALVQGVSIQGGAVGLVAGTGVEVSGARFSGQRRAAVVVQGALALSGSKLVASVEGIDGVVVEPAASLTATDTFFEGGFRRAVTARNATVRLRSVSGEGARTLLHALDSTTTVEKVRTAHGSGPGIFVAGGTLEADDVQVEGHEFSLQLGQKADGRVSHLTAVAPLLGCVSGVLAKLTLRSSRLQRCGDIGVTLMESTGSLTDVDVDGAREMGLFLRGGRTELQRVSVASVTRTGESLGDALHVRAGELTGGRVSTSDLDGSGLYASVGATVQLEQLEVARAHSSAVFVEWNASVTLGALLVRGGNGPALLVPGAARVHITSFSVAGGTESPVYAECRSGAEVKIGRLESTVPQLPSACVQLTK